MKKNSAILFSVFILFHGAAHGATVPAAYSGNWNVSAYGDMNISDPISNPTVIQAHQLNVTVAPSGDPARDLDISVTSGANSLHTSLDISCPNCIADLPIRNTAWPGSWPDFGSALLDVELLNEGNAMAMGIVGQDPSDHTNTAFLYSTWQKTPVPITRNDFLGTWIGYGYGDPNLRNASEGFLPDLSTSDLSTFTFTAGSQADTIYLNGVWELGILELKVDGNRASLSGLPNHSTSSSSFLSFEFLHGGDGIVFTFVGQEDDDLSDISLTIGGASPVPLPTSAWMLLSGVAVLLWIYRRNLHRA